MTDHADLSSLGLSAVAALIADPTRAHMLTQLLGGTAHTAGELARAANVSPQTASNHLSQLLAGNLVKVNAQGRHRYYALSGPEVAQVLEALAVVQHRPVQKVGPRVPAELRFARSCYDHLAGELGVQLTDALLEQGFLNEHWELTDSGKAWFTRLGVNIRALTTRKRHVARACLDWSERRPHLGGPLGAALLAQLLALGWLARVEGRELRVTVPGALALQKELNLTVNPQSRAS